MKEVEQDDYFTIPIETKVCHKCKLSLVLSQFGTETGTPGLRKTACKNCLNKANIGSGKARQTLGGQPPDGHVCLCRKVYQAGKGTKRDWVPDHDHELNRTRGWLCRECNTSMGKASDDPEILLNQIAYLVSHGKKIAWSTMMTKLVEAEKEWQERKRNASCEFIKFPSRDELIG